MKKILAILFISALGLTSCKESFIDVPPVDPGTSDPVLAEILYAKATSDSSWSLETMNADRSSMRVLMSLSDNALYVSKPVKNSFLYYNFTFTYPQTSTTRYLFMATDSTNSHFVSNVRDLAAASLSPDASKILYTAHSINRHELHVMNSDGTGDLLLAKDIEDGFTPAFSPDGKKIAFVTDDRKGGPGKDDDTLSLINIDGTGRMVIYKDKHGLDRSTLSWSPDGNTILVIGDDKNERKLILVKADGSGDREVVKDKTYKYFGSFSPDGKSIVFLINESGRVSIATVPVAGGNYEKMYSGQDCEIKSPSFSNDNSKILFISEDTRIILPDTEPKHEMKLLDIATKTTRILSQKTYIAHPKR
jgi:Tol biopolymer transport system component